jgi:sterol desaturase/sphingolipid hydroxylase (fatty acid hydroxylase superfamily)
LVDTQAFVVEHAARIDRPAGKVSSYTPQKRVDNIVLFSIPLFVLSMVFEGWRLRRRRDLIGYDARDTFASLTMGLLNVFISAGTKLAAIPWFQLVYEHRVADLGGAWWSWIVLLFAEDCCYYWFHRVHHEVRLLWAAHVVHHSSQHFNLSTALRQTLLTPITAPIFWTPLPLLGFPVWMVLLAQGWSLLYQFWIHTELIGRIGPLELVLNTPSHHRVHHGKNVRYLDKNHAGILIIWDKLFGTFAPETERVRFGLTKDIETFHPLKIGFHEVAAIVRDIRRAPTLRAKLGYVFAPPGWSHDGSTQTASELQRRL